MRKVLVVGATGTQGHAQVRALVEQGYPTSALSRQRRRPDVGEPGDTVDFVEGDLLQPSGLPAALAGADTVFLNLPSASFNPPQSIVTACRNFLTAAELVGTQRVIFNASLYVGDMPVGHVAHDNRLEIIRLLLSSAIPVTVVCPVIFMENLLQEWALPDLLTADRLYYPHTPDLPVSWITLDDVARIMIRLAGDDRAIGRRFVVGGPRALRGDETAAALGRAWGRSIRFESRPVDDFARAMAEQFAPNDLEERQRIRADLLSVYRWYNEMRPSPFTVDMAAFLAEFPLSLTSVEEWARHNNPFTLADSTE